MEGSKKPFSKLTDDNYYQWSYDVEMLLGSKGLYAHLYPLQEDQQALIKDPTWLLNDKKAVSLIGLNVDNKFISIVRKHTYAHEIWNDLRSQFTLNSAGAILRLKTEFFEAPWETLNRLSCCNHTKT